MARQIRWLEGQVQPVEEVEASLCPSCSIQLHRLRKLFATAPHMPVHA